jgi:hypothetical protein
MLMKAIPTTPSVRKADASLDEKLNPVELANNEIVSWGVAFPRPGDRTPLRVAEAITSLSTKTPHPVWRTDATIASVLGSIEHPAVTDDSDASTP